MANSELTYFIQEIDRNGLIKIGQSANVQARLTSGEAWNPHDLAIIATTVVPERSLHKRFRDCRLRHEWFAPHPELIDWIKGHADMTAIGELAMHLDEHERPLVYFDIECAIWGVLDEYKAKHPEEYADALQRAAKVATRRFNRRNPRWNDRVTAKRIASGEL